MKRIITSAAAVAILTAGLSGPVWAFGNLSVSSTVNNNRDHSQKFGNGATQNSSNRLTTNRNDNRRWDDHRDYSDRSSTSTTDSRSQSTTDSRNMSDNSNRSDNRSTVDSHNVTDNRIDNTRHQSHNLGDNSIMINGGYQPRVGHENASIGTISGENAYIDSSVSGNFGIGHTTTK